MCVEKDLYEIFNKNFDEKNHVNFEPRVYLQTNVISDEVNTFVY